MLIEIKKIVVIFSVLYYNYGKFIRRRLYYRLGISPQTYNGYERGRNEPPIEILVHISYLYEIPIDILVQHDRLHKYGESAMITLSKMEEEIAQIRNDFKESPNAENPLLNILLAMMQQVIDTSKTMVSESEDRSTKSHRR